MIARILFLLGLVLLAQSYTEENHVLILTADDFPGVIEEFPLIMIQFYAPWCGHCKRLAPIYDEVAKELHDNQVPVRVAKIDADEHSSVKGTYEVQGFPTIYFFSNGQKLKYSGQRTKDFMVNWLTKKTRPALSPIEADKLEEIAASDKVSIVLYGAADGESAKGLESLAVADDYNTYYLVSGTDKAEGTVEIYRPFGSTESTTFSENLKNWIGKYERPTVYPFDDRTIGGIFGESGVGVILFHSGPAGQALGQAFNSAAEEIRVNQGKHLIVFTDIELNAEHYNGLANYIKIATPKSPVVIIDGGKRVKFVMQANPVDVTSEQIVKFVEDFEKGELKEYKIDEEVVYADGPKVDQEL